MKKAKTNYEKSIDELMENTEKVWNEKSVMYASNDDLGANFRTSALLNGLTPIKVTWLYASKHISALNNLTSKTQFTKEELEDIKEKCTDIQNYLKHVYAQACEMTYDVNEEKEEKPKKTTTRKTTKKEAKKEEEKKEEKKPEVLEEITIGLTPNVKPCAKPEEKTSEEKTDDLII